MNGRELPPLLPPSASTISGELDLLFGYITLVSTFFAVLIAVLLVVFAILYRQRRHDDVGADIHGSTPLELVWTGIPVLIVLSFFFWGADLFFRMRTPPAVATKA